MLDVSIVCSALPAAPAGGVLLLLLLLLRLGEVRGAHLGKDGGEVQ